MRGHNTSSNDNSLLPTLASVGLFLGTTLLYKKWYISKHSNKNNDNNVNNDDECFGICYRDLRTMYHKRRMVGRLSYENLDLLPTSTTSTTAAVAEPTNEAGINNNNNNDNVDTSYEHEEIQEFVQALDHLQQSPTRHQQVLPPLQESAAAAAAASLSKDNLQQTEIHPQEEHDFHPKNSNWSHFERYSAEDRKRRQSYKLHLKRIEQQKLRQKFLQQQLMLQKEQQEEESLQQNNAIICGNETDEDKQSSSDSEEEFVWTTSSRHVTIPPEWVAMDHHGDDEDHDANMTARTATTVATNMTAPTLTSSVSAPAAEVNTHYDTSPRIPKTLSRLSLLADNDAAMQNNNSNNNGARAVAKRRHSSLGLTNTSNSYKNDTRATTPPAAPPTTPVTNPLFESSFSIQPAIGFVQRFLSSGASSDNSVVSDDEDEINLEFTLRNSRTIRAEYNARIMPEKVVMIRHGQSMGNINEVLYSTTPDNSMPLTDLGWEQAKMAGRILKRKVIAKGETVHFIVSPYVRTVETFHGIVSAWCDPKEFAHIEDREKRVKAWYGRLMEMGLTWNEDPRIREQDFGNYQDPEIIKQAKRERHRFGVFYYRFPHGESASDVFDRVSTFLDSLWRSFEMNKSRNYVLVTHGISIRVLLARYFRYTIDQFNILANPKNCEMVVLGHDGDGKLELNGRCELEVTPDETTNEKHVTGYCFHKRLRILPDAAIRKVKIRISPDD